LNFPHKAGSRLRCYTKDQIPVIWDRVKPHIKKALDRGSNYSIEDVYDGLLFGEMVLWVWQADDCKGEIYAALVTTIETRKNITYCLFLALGGSKLDEWIEFLPVVEEWAKDNGAEEMRIYGRIGWARHIGYDIQYTKMTKRL
jgi:hypothetical protein